MPFAFAGGFIVQGRRRRRRRAPTSSTTAIGCALLLAAGSYALRMYLQLRFVTGGNVLSTDEPHVRALPTIVVGAVGGLLVGITSVGSGSLIMVSLLLLYPTLSARPASSAPTWSRRCRSCSPPRSGTCSPRASPGTVLIPLVLGSTPGTFLGARLAAWVSQSVIRRGIVIVLP